MFLSTAKPASVTLVLYKFMDMRLVRPSICFNAASSTTVLAKLNLVILLLFLIVAKPAPEIFVLDRSSSFRFVMFESGVMCLSSTFLPIKRKLA